MLVGKNEVIQWLFFYGRFNLMIVFLIVIEYFLLQKLQKIHILAVFI